MKLSWGDVRPTYIDDGMKIDNSRRRLQATGSMQLAA
jgi:hypothetical protein